MNFSNTFIILNFSYEEILLQQKKIYKINKIIA